MKLVNSLIVVVVLAGGLLLALALSGAVGPAMPEVQAQERGDSVNAAAEDTGQPAPEAGGMPGWPIPAKPIPHHEPGQPARSGNAIHQVTRLNASGEDETVELRGLDALLADGTVTDPLQGNYQLVGLDKVMFGAYDWVTSDFSVQSFEFVTSTSTLDLMPNSTQPFGHRRFTDIAAGDLNGDFVDEQIVAWVDPDDGHIWMQVGELPGSLGKATSAPAVVADGDSLDVVVRGYDQALWRLRYDKATWGRWDNDAGGRLLSAPAVAYRESGELDVFAVGDYNQVWHRVFHSKWPQPSWNDWMKVDGGTVFISETVRSVPPPEIPAPAVVANGDQLDLFRLGPDNTLWWRHSNDGDTWGAWQNLGGMLASGPGAVLVSGGGVEVYALGMDGALWYRGTGGGPGAWMRLETPDGVAGNAVPVPVSPDADQVKVYLAGTENRIWWIQRDGTKWGSWTSTAVDGGEIELGLGIGAAGAHLFAQMSDGSLQYKLNTTDWAPLDGLPVSQTVKTDAIAKALPADDERENPILDITTGYFSGDGRQQVVLAYHGADDRLRLEVYDIDDGFALTRTLQLPAYITPGRRFPRVAAGDVDGDGVDEIALVNANPAVLPFGAPPYWEIRVYKVTAHTSGNWDLVETNYCYLAGPTSYQFGGTLRIAAGDIVPDTTPTPNDEFAVVVDWYRVDTNASPWRYQEIASIWLYDYGKDPANLAFHFFEALGPPYPGTESPYATGIGLAVGDVNGPQKGYGSDEIVLIWPRGNFKDLKFPDLRRDVVVCGVKEDGTFVIHAGYEIPGSSWYSYLDTVAVGDLDQDLVDEIVVAANRYGEGYWLDVYEFATLSTGPVARYHLPYSEGYTPPLAPRAFNLAMGDFTGESLRVGPPSYRVQNQMTTPEVFLNLPPMHRDIVSGAGEIEIFNGAQAIHSAGNSTSASSTAESKRDWSLSAGMETSIGVFGSTVSTSMSNTYGENFSTSTTQISTTEFEDTTTADNYDQVIYNGTDYAIWEYPVYGVPGDDQDNPRTISVVFPLVTTTSQPVTQQGRTCDENFYAPSHQPYNVWSYDPMGSGVDFDDYGKQIETKQTSGGSDFVVRMSAVSELERSESFHNQFSAGLEYSYENELNIPFVGKAWDFSFRASMDGSFGHENNSTLSSSFTEASTVQVDFPSTPDPSNYAIKAYLYWAKAGYLVVDYQTQPTNAGSWLLYNKPDPAFILPWYGFPDPATGVFPSPPSPDAPPCGLDRQLFTHDIEVDPGYVQNGDTVTITATVRNFSNVNPPQNVAVRFYLGDPTTGSPIGTCTILKSKLDRDLGPQQCATTWVVSGAAGEEKIYARIDPDNAFDEMHDEDDVINNNVGYGLLYVASADYFDPGLRQTQPYQAILYKDAPGLRQVQANQANPDEDAPGSGFGLYLPTTNITETVRYELVPTTLGNLRIVGEPIQVLAFRGGEAEPEDDHTFAPIPAGMMALYRDDGLLPGMDEDDLNLYRLDGSDWVVAVCPGYEDEIVRFSADNRVAVPICQTGVFVLSDAPPGPTPTPVARFSAAPTSGLAPLSVAFTDLSSNFPTSWQWDFGDGHTSMEQNPIHMYNTPGAFTVSLTATNTSGSDTLTKPDYITVIEAKEKIYLPLVLRAAP